MSSTGFWDEESASGFVHTQPRSSKTLWFVIPFDQIGKYGSTEVDFVTQKEGVLTYYQVTADMTAEETFEREMRPLRSIHDNYEKIVLTLDRFSLGNYDGIKVVNVIDWLLG